MKFLSFKPLRGGRMTKVNGVVGSYAPAFGAMLTAIMLTGGAGQALAADECGVDAPGADTITCSAGSYPGGITYTNSDGLTLILNDAAIVVGNPGVHVTGTGTGDIAVTGTSFGTITTGGALGYGIFSGISNATSTATATATLTAGDIATTGFAARGLFALTSGLGSSVTQMDGGTVTTGGEIAYGLGSWINNATSTATASATLSAGDIATTGDNGYGLYALTNGLGTSVAQMDGGTVNTGGRNAFGLFSRIINATSTATASATLSAGDIATTGDSGIGLYAWTSGLGSSVAQMDGGTITTGGAEAYGLFSLITNATSTATASATLSAGDIATTGDNGIGLYARTAGLGSSVAQMDGGTVTTGRALGYGLLSQITNTTSTATATATLTAGDIATTGFAARGLFAANSGLGSAVAQMDGGTVTTGGAEAYGLLSNINNATSTATASATLSAGDIATTGDIGYGVYALTNGLGTSVAQMDGGTVNTGGRSAFGLFSLITNATSTATASATLSAGDIATTGYRGYGLYALTSGLGSSVTQMDGGTVTTGGAEAYGLFSLITNATSTATASATLSAGDIATTGNIGYGLYARTTGLGNTVAQVDGGTITTGGTNAYGLFSWISNTTSEATATATLTAGDIATTGDSGFGLYAWTAGLGRSVAQVDGGTVTTGGAEAYGLLSQITNVASEATATATLTAGDIATAGDNGFGLYAWTAGLGASVAQVDGGTITTGGTSAYGLFSRISNTTSEATATATLTAGDIATAGDNGFGLYAWTAGLGASVAQMDGGTVTTGGAEAYGLLSQITNVASEATATATLTAGDIATAGDNGFGLYAWTAGLGASVAQVDGGTITTGGTSAYGLFSRISNTTSEATATATLSAGDIATTGDDAHGVYTLNAGLGDVVVTTVGSGTITTSGAGANGIQTVQDNAAATGTTTITLGSDIVAGGDGINVNSLSSGAVLITGNGNITGGTDVGDDGIEVNAVGSVTVNVNGTVTGDPGILISSVNGPVNIAGTGNVIGLAGNGIDAAITGAAATGDIAVARDGDITGADNGILTTNDGTGNIAITSSRAVTGGSGYGINTATAAGGTSTITLNAGATVSSTAGLGIFNNGGNSTILVNSGADVAGEIRLNDGSDTLTFAGDFSNVTVFDGGDDVDIADGFIDTLTLNGAGTVNGGNILNWERFNIANNLAVTGGTLTAGTTNIVSGGTLDAGNNLDLNSNLNILTGGIFDGTGAGAGVYNIAGNVSNAGLITTQDGVVGDVVTITGDYTGGGAIKIDTELSGDDTKTDKIIVNGDSSGTTVVYINNVGGTGGLITGGGVRIVQVDGFDSGRFDLGGPVSVGAFNYSLTSAGYLQSTLSAQVYGYSSIAAGLREDVGSLWQRSGQDSELFNYDGSTSKSGSGLWIQASYFDTNAEADTLIGDVGINTNVHVRRANTQIGYKKDLLSVGNGFLTGGVFGHYKQTNIDVNDAENVHVASATANGYGGGLSLTWDSPSGYYGDLLGQFTAYDVDVKGNNGSSGSFDTLAYSFSAEAGYRFDLDNSIRVVPQGQLIWSRSNFDDFADSDDIVVDWNEKSMLTGRVGLALEGGNTIANGGTGLTGYVIANLLHDFNEASSLNAAGTEISSQLSRNQVEVRVGANLADASNKFTFFTEAGIRRSIDSLAYTSYKGIVGLKVSF